jgi:hypothetical protein
MDMSTIHRQARFSQFQSNGFYVLATSIILGVEFGSVSRFGWLQQDGESELSKIKVDPTVMKKVHVLSYTRQGTSYFPFLDQHKIALHPQFLDALKARDAPDAKYRPIFCYSGDDTKCPFDYIFMIPSKDGWQCFVGDSKFSSLGNKVETSEMLKVVEGIKEWANLMKDQENGKIAEIHPFILTVADLPVQKKQELRDALSSALSDLPGKPTTVSAIHKETFQLLPWSMLMFFPQMPTPMQITPTTTTPTTAV